MASGGIQDKIAWLRQLLAWRQELGDSSELAQHFRTNCSRMRCSCPRPRARSLP